MAVPLPVDSGRLVVPGFRNRPELDAAQELGLIDEVPFLVRQVLEQDQPEPLIGLPLELLTALLLLPRTEAAEPTLAGDVVHQRPEQVRTDEPHPIRSPAWPLYRSYCEVSTHLSPNVTKSSFSALSFSFPSCP